LTTRRHEYKFFFSTIGNVGLAACNVAVVVDLDINDKVDDVMAFMIMMVMMVVMVAVTMMMMMMMMMTMIMAMTMMMMIGGGDDDDGDDGDDDVAYRVKVSSTVLGVYIGYNSAVLNL